MSLFRVAQIRVVNKDNFSDTKHYCCAANKLQRVLDKIQLHYPNYIILSSTRNLVSPEDDLDNSDFIFRNWSIK